MRIQSKRRRDKIGKVFFVVAFIYIFFRFDRKNLVQHTGKFKVAREICIPCANYANGTYIIIPRYYLMIFFSVLKIYKKKH